MSTMCKQNCIYWFLPTDQVHSFAGMKKQQTMTTKLWSQTKQQYYKRRLIHKTNNNTNNNIEKAIQASDSQSNAIIEVEMR